MRTIIPTFLFLLVLFSCKEKEKTATTLPRESETPSKLSKSYPQNSSDTDSWKGYYHFEASNKDQIKTAFDIDIQSLNDISIQINEDGNTENYSHIKAERIDDDTIKIVYNPSFEDEMGVIYIEKSGHEYLISGNPIYFINPGNGEMPLKKIK